MNLGVCAILWVGGIQVNVGELTQGQVMAFVNYMTQTLTSIVYVANLVVVFTKASASASRINEVLNCVPSIADEGNEPVALPEPSELAGGAVPVPALSFEPCELLVWRRRCQRRQRCDPGAPAGQDARHYRRHGQR